MAKEGLTDIQVRNIPDRLLREFDEATKKDYPGGRSEAIRDLMRRFIRENKGPNEHADVPK